MTPADLPAFTTMLDATCSLLSQGRYEPSDSATLLFFNTLTAFPVEMVRWAFDQYVQTAKFPPTPSEILTLLRGADGRPGAEEAWAMVVQAHDESRTVVWTQEMAEAWALAVPVMDLGDEVGARMAFREAYTERVQAARAALKPAVWQVSEGHDAAGRARVLADAVLLGRLPPNAVHLLPAPREKLALAAPEETAELTEERRAFLTALRDRMAAPVEHQDAAAADRERTAQLKREHDERMAAELSQHHGQLAEDTRQVLSRMTLKPIRALDPGTLTALNTLNQWRRER